MNKLLLFCFIYIYSTYFFFFFFFFFLFIIIIFFILIYCIYYHIFFFYKERKKKKNITIIIIRYNYWYTLISTFLPKAFSSLDTNFGFLYNIVIDLSLVLLFK